LRAHQLPAQSLGQDLQIRFPSSHDGLLRPVVVGQERSTLARATRLDDSRTGNGNSRPRRGADAMPSQRFVTAAVPKSCAGRRRYVLARLWPNTVGANAQISSSGQQDDHRNIALRPPIDAQSTRWRPGQFQNLPAARGIATLAPSGAAAGDCRTNSLNMPTYC
jgi:hypothetical protein